MKDSPWAVYLTLDYEGGWADICDITITKDHPLAFNVVVRDIMGLAPRGLVVV